jgi:hypothetical protein
MRKLKLFLEFINSNKKSLFIPMTYEVISKKLKCSLDDVEDFEIWLQENIKPGEIFHGSLGSDEIKEKPVDIFDNIEDEDDYIEMWKQYKGASDGHSSGGHHEDGL